MKSSQAKKLGFGFLTRWTKGQRKAEAQAYQRGFDKNQAALETLQAEANELRKRYDGYRAAFEILQDEATELRKGCDGYRGAFETCCAQLALAQDERDRILRSLEKLRAGKKSLPPGLAGRQLCFMHIGKTAGTSLQEALFDAMHDAAIFHESLPNFDTASAAELAINDLVIGHFAYQHVAKLRSDRFLMTFLRDPVERVVSNYHYLRSSSPVARYSEQAINAAKRLAIREFLLCEEPGVRMVTENLQAKTLARDIRPEHQGAILDLHKEAERNLSTFDFVGIVEYFEDSVAALSRKIGADLIAKRVNVTAERLTQPPASSEEIELIRRLNAVDIALYRKARKAFQENASR